MKTARVFKKIPQSLLQKFLSDLKLEDSNRYKRLYIVGSTLARQIGNDSISKDELKSLLPKDYDSKLIQKDLHDLNEKLIDFLAKEELKHQMVIHYRMKLKAADRYGLSEMAQNLFQEGNKSINDINELDNDFNLEKYLFLKLKFGEKNNLVGRSVIPDEKLLKELKEVYTGLANAYHVECLKLNQFFNISNKILQNDGIKSLPLTIEVEKHNNAIYQLSDIYRRINSFLEQKPVSIAQAQELVSTLDKSIRISEAEFETILTNLTNVFVRQSNYGNKEFDSLHFHLHKLAIRRNHYKNRFNPKLYRNIIRLACDEEDYNWALHFSNEYRHKLPPKDQDTAYSFNKMRILWNMKDYDGVIETVRNIEYKDATYNLNSKLALMTSFYELDEYETLISTIRAFKVFLRRRRNISVQRKANFTGFSDTLYNIVMAEENRDIKRVKKAQEIIDNNPAIPNTDWLREKISELKIK